MKFLPPRFQEITQKANDSPYINGHEAWLARYGDFIQSAKHWRMIGMSALAVAIASIGANAYLLSQQKIVPFIVETNQHSEVVRVSRADVMGEPTLNQKRAGLAEYVKGFRTVYGDSMALQYVVNKAYAMTLPESAAYKEMSGYHKENNPYVRAQKETVDVAVTNVLLMPNSTDTFDVEWTEVTKNLSGKVTDSKAWKGAFTIVIVPPTTNEEMIANPIGIRVKAFSISPRLL